MSDEIFSITHEDLPIFLRFCERYGFKYAHHMMSFRDFFQRSTVEDFDRFVRMCFDVPDRDISINPSPSLDLGPDGPDLDPYDYGAEEFWNGLDNIARENFSEPLPIVPGSPEDDREKFQDDEGFDKEAWERFLSEPDHPRYI